MKSLLVVYPNACKIFNCVVSLMVNVLFSRQTFGVMIDAHFEFVF